MNPLPQSDLPPAEAVLPLDAPEPSAPTWLNLLLGQLLLRACPCGSKVDSCQSCHVGPLCHCAHGHLRAAAVVESRFWLVLTLTAGLALYSVLTPTLHH